MWARVIDADAGACIAAAVDTGAEARSEFAAGHPDVPVFATLEEALANGSFRAAVLVTPPDGHLAQCGRLFEAGLPVLAEKPLAVELSDAVEIIDLADRHALPLSVGLNFRFLPVHQKQRELLTTEFLGTVGFGEFIYRRNRDGRRPGINKYPLTMRHPMMLEQSIHHLDLIRYCYGREVESIMCRTWNPPWSMYAHDANVHALLTLEGGVAVNYFGTWSGGWNVPGFEWRTDCEGGVIVQRELFSELGYARTSDKELTPVALAPAEAFYDDTALLLKEFLHATAVPCDGRDHLRTLALCFAGIESSETGRAVDMRQFYAEHDLTRLL
jgi:predicted dehydrogenase